MSTSSHGVGRLAMRKEGKHWVAYFAAPNTMKDAIQIASVRLTLVQSDERKDAFLGLMKELVADMIQEVTGARPTWPTDPAPAPEHEKAGHA